MKTVEKMEEWHEGVIDEERAEREEGIHHLGRMKLVDWI